GSSGSMTISGANASLNSGGLYVGNAGTATMNVQNGGSVSNATGYVGLYGSGNVNVTGNGSRWSNSNGVFFGGPNAMVNSGQGDLNISSGGRVQVGNDNYDSGTSSELIIGDMNAVAAGTMTVRNGSTVVNDGSGYVAASASSVGLASVSGAGSRWENSGDLYIGRSGFGTLEVSSGGVVENHHGYIASHGATSTATVTGAGSHWANAGNLSVGAAGVGSIEINDSGLVTVGGTTTIGADDAVTLAGGRFEFGTSSLSSFARMGGSSGELAGLVTNTAFTNISTLTTLQSNSLDISEVNVSNSGTIIGTGSILAGFTNNTTGRVDVSGSSTMRFEGDNNSNSGRINSTGGLLSLAGNLTNTGTGRITNLGGQVVSEGQVTNMAGGLISGRGEFTAEGGFQNHGTMAFSGGFADVVGDVHNFAGSLIVTSGNATTTFFEDVVHNGAEIRTSADSATVFLGEVSGAGSFTGTGSVFFEGDLRPGNSPGIVSFGGDVILGPTAVSHFEIGGLMAGINGFDQLQITGDLFLNDSMLDVSFINSFSLGSNQQFLIAAVGGNVNGQFQGLGEGALVGNFSGTDLFITYSAGGGNGIALFSAVPEPSALLLVGSLMGFASLRRTRKTLNESNTAV
ncbi:MAG: PEP-CTERM sorting domain-containing protein, partial [Planctomycetaceae bacterium]|nr:PEP-CTERM sorting domain-containing protein [Planctomycetaceae bacterium]